MKVVFFGTPVAAVPTLRGLISAGIGVEMVVTQPGRGVRRGRRGAPSPVFEAAGELGLSVETPLKLTEFTERLEGCLCDAGVVVAYGQIIPESLIGFFPLGIVNLHFSLLPRWRGAAPVQRAILAGDARTGASVMLIDAGLDTGPVLTASEMAIRDDDDCGSLTEALAVIGAPLVVSALESLQRGTAAPIPQDDAVATYAPKLTQAECQIDWRSPVDMIDRQIRAAVPAPGAFTEFRGKRLKILKARPAERNGASSTVASVGSDSPEPGTMRLVDGAMLVGTGTTPLELLEIQVEGRKALPVASFAVGARLTDGETLGV